MAQPFRLHLAKLIAGKHWPTDGEAAFTALMDRLPAYLVFAIHDALAGEVLTLTPIRRSEDS